MTGAITHRFGFVVEQTLGHVTHYKNLWAAVDGVAEVDATWYPLPFAPRAGLQTLPGIRDNWSARASLGARQVLRGDVASHAFDALFFHTQVTTLLSVGVMRRIPTVVSLDATPINYDMVGAAYGHQPAKGAAERMKRALNKRSLHAARALVTWCNWARQSLIDDYGVDPARITVIAPGVNLALWPLPVPKTDMDVVRLLFVGADFERKGGTALLRAFEHMRDRCELHIVTKARVEPAPGVYVYRDVAPNSELLKQLYARADLFVLPTLADCFPLVIQEAMAAGLPVIATDVGAIGEVVRDGDTGLLVPANDPAPLGAAIDTLVQDSARRRALGGQGRALAEQCFDSVANAQRILGILKTIADAP